jgi:hypothetical protein
VQGRKVHLADYCMESLERMGRLECKKVAVGCCNKEVVDCRREEAVDYCIQEKVRK